MAGRPSLFSTETATAICELLAEGQSLRSICERDEMPSARTVHRWIEENEIFCQQYTRARETQAETLIDQIIEIADAADEDTVQAARLQIDTRKWFAGKVAAKKYGDKSTTDVHINGTLAHESAGLSALADFVKQAITSRTAPVIEGDVQERSLLPALLRPETPGSGK